MSLGPNIKFLVDLLHSKGVTYASAAEFCETDPQAIHGLVARNSKKSQYAARLAKYFKVPLDLLLDGQPAELKAYLSGESSNTTMVLNEPRTAGYLVGVPVTNILSKDIGGLYEMKDPIGFEGRIHWPTKDHEAFAVRVEGSEYSPRIRHGEFIIVEPNRSLQPGIEVVVETLGQINETRLMIFNYERDGMHYFDDINKPGISTHIESNQIKYIACISAITNSVLFIKEGN